VRRLLLQVGKEALLEFDDEAEDAAAFSNCFRVEETEDCDAVEK
jgi:hypothetical protein